MGTRRILVVDDERNMQAVLKLLFEGEGLETTCVSDGAEALALIESGERFGVVVSDLKMDRLDGIGLLRALHERGNGLPFILITAYGTIEKAVEAMKLGAVDVVTKPFTKEILLNTVGRILRLGCLEDETEILRDRKRGDELVWRSPAMAALVGLLERIGPAAAPVLITGESGTGKEVAARMLHRAYAGGSFDARPFVSVNCPAMPESLLESELFGYRKGAFTGAEQDFKGRVELAEGGTLFFDEIGDLPAAIQPKILRLLENRTYEPLGTGRTRKVDIRIVCATNRNLKRLVAEGRFREDLFYRINTFTIEMPPLRDRLEDVEPLAAAFLERYRRETAKSISGFSRETMRRLVGYRWPGNTRELKNVIERAVVLSQGSVITAEDLPAELRADAGPGPVPPAAAPVTAVPAAGGDAIAANERRMIVKAMSDSGGNISAAARLLGLSRNTLRYRLKKHGLVDAAGRHQWLK